MLATRDEQQARLAGLVFLVLNYLVRSWLWIVVALAALVLLPAGADLELGYPALAAAREVWVLASGEGKAGALRDSLTAGSDTPLGRVLHSREQTEIFTDFEV